MPNSLSGGQSPKVPSGPQASGDKERREIPRIGKEETPESAEAEFSPETARVIERALGEVSLEEPTISPIKDKREVIAAPPELEDQLVMPTSWQKFQQGLVLTPQFALAWLARLVERLQKIASFRHWKVFWRG